ncbi:uncharacterized protein LOC120277929 [Dioscorea cayenensis subsp. rotundata]|uniref:Uncharacterized protein LOC120277929 n=1 Tax=Dioscorea cayennensis subsp. rotundata TaxID=55577 RepID=A0AB40CL89_DIOCR|nr:uncharacterized protein LOC120277929 [Dioscorea cayenensis subsp. rotundata]
MVGSFILAICKKTMIETENGELACYDHGQGIPKLTLRLRMIMKDETADMEITAFDKQAELMTNLNVDFLQAIEEISQTIVPEKILAVVKKKFTFTVGLPPKAIKDDVLTYRIYRIKPIQLEGQSSTQTQKVQLAFTQSSMDDKSEITETKPQNDTDDTLESFLQVGLPQNLALVESPAKKQRRGKEKIE